MTLRKWAMAPAILLAVGTAHAHMPYVAPTLFDVGGRSKVAVEASFTEDAFRAEIAMKDAPFEIIGPDGATRRLGAPTVLTEVTIIEADLPEDGIYRISSGQRLGRMGRMYRDGAAWKMIGEGAKVPADVQPVAVQSTTLADAYVSRGKGEGGGALRARGAALEIHPLANPTTVGAGEALPVEILFDGKPLAGATLSLFRETGFYDGKKTVGDITADSAGKAAIIAPDAGRYLILVRHRGPGPAGAAAPYYSFTVTLAFEAM